MLVTPGLIAVALLACGVSGWSAPEKLKWWQTGIVYQVYPRSFKDSDGDGIGDLPGITSKLSHLKDIGVSAVWLSPIYPSPQADFGYDIANFTDVDKAYGTLDDFDKLVEEAHKLGLKVVLDMVPNHSSDEHPWFKMSEDTKHPEHQKYKDYYIWADAKGWLNPKQPPNNWLSVFRGKAWTYNEKRKQFYLHQFHYKQPDLNFRNPEVVNAMKDVIRFWVNRKIDGFRVDAVPFLFEDTGLRNEPKSGYNNDPNDHASLNHIYTQNLPETYDMIQQWREVLDEYQDADRVMMAEVYASLEDTLKYYGTKERPGSHFPFNFYLVTDLNQASNATDFKTQIDKWMSNMNDYRWPNWVIGNHDQKRVATRFGPELADSMNMISLSLPGTAMTYNGEEIGMTDNFIRWEDTLDPQARNKGQKDYLSVSRDPCRTPFQWDTSDAAGFSTNVSTWLPVNPNYWNLNVENQKNGKTHLSIYKKMTDARKLPTIQRGDVKVTAEGHFLIIERILPNEPTFMLVVNLGTRETKWSHPDIGKMSIWTSSMNSGLKDGSKLSGSIYTKPKAAYLLTDMKSSAIKSASSVLTIVGLVTLVYNFTRNLF